MRSAQYRPGGANGGKVKTVDRAEMHYTVKSTKAFDDAVKAVEERCVANGFRVQHIHDVQATLRSKGLEMEPLKIIEVCDAPHAHAVLSKDILVSLMMPCKINVYSRNGETYISGLRPTMLAQFFPEANLQEVAQEVDAIVRRVIDEAAA